MNRPCETRAAKLDSENEVLQAELAAAHQSALEEKERELVGLRAQPAATQSPGRPALTVLARRLRSRDRHRC